MCAESIKWENSNSQQNNFLLISKARATFLSSERTRSMYISDFSLACLLAGAYAFFIFSKFCSCIKPIWLEHVVIWVPQFIWVSWMKICNGKNGFIFKINCYTPSNRTIHPHVCIRKLSIYHISC